MEFSPEFGFLTKPMGRRGLSILYITLYILICTWLFINVEFEKKNVFLWTCTQILDNIIKKTTLDNPEFLFFGKPRIFSTLF